MNTFSLVILANGEFPHEEKTISILREADLLVCCDGAVNSLSSVRAPDCIVGDLDSISAEERINYGDILIYNPDQENNDLTKAFHYAISVLKRDKVSDFNISILGATGKREDHTLGNISLLPQYATVLKSIFGSSPISIITDYGKFIPLSDSTTFCLPVGTEISIFSFDSTLRIHSQGLEYPTDKVIFDYWWKATLNRTASPQINLHFSHPASALLYIALRSCF